MRPLARDDVIDKRVVEVVIPTPDKPVTMSGQAYSNGYVRLESGLLIDLDSPEFPRSCDERRLREILRDSEQEKTFEPILGQRVVDLLFSDEYAGVCVVLESGNVIAIVPGQFWIGPFLCKHESFPFSRARPAWQN